MKIAMHALSITVAVLHVLPVAAQQFGPAQIVPTSSSAASAVAAADLDGDNDLDILAAQASQALSWYENNNGPGAEWLKHTIGAPTDFGEDVFATDLDGDGDQDVLSALLGDKIAWYENANPIGTLWPWPQQAITTDLLAVQSVFAADLDGDGDQDAVSASQNDFQIAWYKNTDGHGGFGQQQVISLDAVWAVSIFAADLDGDGDQDVLSASLGDGKIAWYENIDEMGSFGPQRIVIQAPVLFSAVYTADLDGDGDEDVLSASLGDNKIAWYENVDGLGDFGPQIAITVATDSPRSVHVADVDGDGDQDVLSASSADSKVAWYENTNGRGSFGPQLVIATDAIDAESVYAADLDGDGDQDVILGSEKIAWYENLAGPLPGCASGQIALPAGAPFDHIGSSIATDGVFVFAGLSSFDGPGFESGAAALTYRDGDTWVELPLIIPSDSSADDLFGHSVDSSGGAVLIGARGVSSEAGAAYVFRQQADGSWAEEAKLEAADPQPGDWLASRVAIEDDVAVAAAPHADAPGADSGAVYVFRDTGSGWVQEAKLTGLDTAAGDQFGKGLALSDSRVLVGAYGDDDAGADSGSAYVFRDDGGFWNQEAKLTASDASPSAQFGNEVALDGDVAVVAARGDSNVGAVYVFRRSGFTWTQEQKLTASTPLAGAEFGSSVAIAGSRILVGAHTDDSVAQEAGAAYLFEFDGSTWTETAKYTLPEAAAKDLLGSSVAFSGDYAMIGAELADDPELDSGELWAFPLPGTCQPQITSVQPTSAQAPAVLTASGFFLGGTQQVTIDGLAATLVEATDVTLTYQPQPGAPGDVPLEASGPDGTAQATQRLYPALTAMTTGVGGVLDVEIDNGDEGLYALALATGSLPSPIPIASPPTWYGVLLDITGPVFTSSTGAFATSDPVSISLPVPSNPALSGLTLHFQGWCQQGFFGSGVSYSFTNEAAVTF